MVSGHSHAGSKHAKQFEWTEQQPCSSGWVRALCCTRCAPSKRPAALFAALQLPAAVAVGASMRLQLSPCVFQSLVVSTSKGASMSSGLLVLCRERSCRREHAAKDVQGGAAATADVSAQEQTIAACKPQALAAAYVPNSPAPQDTPLLDCEHLACCHDSSDTSAYCWTHPDVGPVVLGVCPYEEHCHLHKSREQAVRHGHVWHGRVWNSTQRHEQLYIWDASSNTSYLHPCCAQRGVHACYVSCMLNQAVQPCAEGL
jgi:hypothetical protein